MTEKITISNYKQIWEESNCSQMYELLTPYVNTRTPIKIKCKNCGKIRETRFYEVVKRGIKCECYYKEKTINKYIEEKINEIYSYHGKNCIDYVEAIDENTFTFQCNICGYTFEKTKNGLYQDSKHNHRFPCSLCKGRTYSDLDNETLKDIKINKYTFEYLWYERLKLYSIFRILSMDENNLRKIKVRCLICNKIFDLNTYEYLIRGSRHGHRQELRNKKVNKQNIEPKKKRSKKKEKSPLQIKYLQERLDKETEKGHYIILEGSNNWSDKTLIKCNICDYKWNVRPSDLSLTYNNTGKFRCPSCNKMIRQFPSYDDLIAWMINKRPDIDISALSEDEYNSFKNKRRTKIDALCKKCGNIWKAELGNLLQGSKCPRCSKHAGISSLEEKIKKFLLNSGIKDNDIIMRSRKILPSGKELDIYLPKYKLAIELNGLYWHSEKYKGRNYHLEKKKEASDIGIKLLQFYDDDYSSDTKRKIIEDKILTSLGKIKHRVYARNCEIKFDVDKNEKAKFLNSNHLQGNDSSMYNVGLYYNRHLVALMTFSKPRVLFNYNDKNQKLELVRYATKLNTSVVGGFSKLLKHFSNKIDSGTVITTFADKNISDGNLYIKNGFILIRESKPSYFYVERNTYKRFNRFKFRKQELKKIYPEIYSDQKTEFQIMDEANEYYRVWNSGNYVFEMKIE